MSLKTPKRLERDKRSPAHKRAPRQEAEVAKRTGSKLTAGSGNQTTKGDCRKRGVVRIECKTTSAKSFSVTMDTINKLETAAAISNELPILVIEFLKGGKPWRSVCVTTEELLDRVQDL
mgnify:CR=1 FL=1